MNKSNIPVKRILISSVLLIITAAIILFGVKHGSQLQDIFKHDTDKIAGSSFVVTLPENYCAYPDPGCFEGTVVNKSYGKASPDSDSLTVQKLEPGRIIELKGSYSTDITWYLANTISQNTSDRISFWVKSDDIMSYNSNPISYSDCFILDVGIYDHVVTGADSRNELLLRECPDEKSTSIATAKKGSLVTVVRTSGKWSLIRKIKISSAEKHFCGWVKNSKLSKYNNDIYKSQAFIMRKSLAYTSKNALSGTALKINNMAAPVTILKTTKSRAYIDTGVGNTRVWINISDLIYSFADKDLNKMRCTIDPVDFVKGFENELFTADNVTLSANDIDKNIILSESQKKSLVQAMKTVYQPEFYADMINPLRQAIYPYYTINLNFNDLKNKTEKKNQINYLFVICDNSKLGMLIPDSRKSKYGLTPEQDMIAYVKTNNEFFKSIEKLLPANPNNDTSNFNHLLNAEKVVVYNPSGYTENGSDIHQVYKCVRTLRSFMGKERNAEKIQPGILPVITFDFILGNKTEKVEVYKDFIIYKGKTYSVTGDTAQINGMLFAGSF